MASKKVIFIIVEGPSDESALGFQFDHFFEKDKVFVDVIHGDITTLEGVSFSNIINKINDEINNEIKRQRFKKKDICRIIHIIDIDGVFIDDENIVFQSNCDKPIYEDECILTSCIDRIKKRNEQKKQILLRLFSNSVIAKIPYKAFYMSVNLDHVLYNKRNLTDEEKEDEAYLFAKKYKDDLNGFVEYINSQDLYSGENYKESIDYLMIDNNSLHRHTNLALLFNEKIEC